MASLMYYGRAKEIDELQRLLCARDGPPSARVAIVGERGIGKSELLAAVYRLCRERGHVTAFASIDPSLTMDNFAARLLLSLSQNARVLGVQMKELVRSLTEVGIPFGFKVTRATPVRSHGNLEEFCFCLIRAIQEGDFGTLPGGEVRPITLFVDEVDAASNAILPIGAALKTIIEYLDFHGVAHVSIVIAGLPTMRRKIYATHPSAWREFRNIVLAPLLATEAEEMIRAQAALAFQQGGAGEVAREDIRVDAIHAILELSDRYPHWINAFTSAAVEQSLRSTSPPPKCLSVHHVYNGREVAIDRVWEDYYASDFEGLDADARVLLRLIAVHCRLEVDLATLRSLASPSEGGFDSTLAVLADRQLIEILDRGMRQTVRMRSIAYRHRLSQMAHPPLDPLQLGAFWQDAAAHLQGVNIVGERGAPTFRAFAELMYEQLGDSDAVVLWEYDATYNLFDSFTLPHAVIAFFEKVREYVPECMSTLAELPHSSRDSEDAVPQRDLVRTVSGDANFATVWRLADLLCIPHYMLGKVTTLGVWTFDELLGDRHERLREYFRYVLHDFDESCTFEGHWIAAPFTYLTKVLVSKDDIVTPLNWSGISGWESGAVRIDDRPGSIALWYEWRQHIVEEQEWPLYKSPRSTDVTPELSDVALEMLAGYDVRESARADASSGGSQSGPLSVERFFETLDSFRRLMVLAARQAQDDRYWGDYETFLGNEPIRVMSMWVDWAAHLARQYRETSSREGGDARSLYWYDLPCLPNGKRADFAVPNPQPLESWVFVIPRKSSSAHHRLQAIKLAELAVSTLSMGWQLQFQRRGGCSPLAWLVHSSGAGVSSASNPATSVGDAAQPWNAIVVRAIDARQPRGKSRREVEFIQAEVALLTALFFDEGGIYSRTLDDAEAFKERFDVLFPLFLQTIQTLSSAAF